jgi:hypothetical protein
MTDPLELAVRAKAAGIALTLEACISPAALRCAASSPESAPAFSSTSDDMPEVDLQRLLNSMQQMLVRALQELQGNLVDQALEFLREQIEARRGSGA